MDPSEIALLAASAGTLAAALAFLVWALYFRYLVIAPPNRALVIFGSRPPKAARSDGLGTHEKIPASRAARIMVGGRAVIFGGPRAYGSLFLGTMDIDVIVRGLRAGDAPGALRFDVHLGVQAKVSSEPEGLRAAAENLLGKSDTEVRALIRSVVEEHLPAAMAQVTADHIEKESERLAAEVGILASTDLIAMGVLVQSVGVKEILPAPVPGADPSSRTDGELVRAVWELTSRLRTSEARLEELERRSRTPEIIPMMPALALEGKGPRVSVLRS
jgi:uncharacterized membrane protein YqiK